MNYTGRAVDDPLRGGTKSHRRILKLIWTQMQKAKTTRIAPNPDVLTKEKLNQLQERCLITKTLLLPSL